MLKTQKDLFLARLMLERERFELLLNRAGYARRMTLKGAAGRWSIKDVLAHVWAYEQYHADRLHEILYDQPYVPCRTQTALDAFLDEFGYPDFGSPLLDEEAPHDWVIEKYRNVSLDDLVAQEIQAFASIVSSIEAMPEHLIHRHNLYQRSMQHTCERYREHTQRIRRWLRTGGVQNT